jgi:hypothetical protein
LCSESWTERKQSEKRRFLATPGIQKGIGLSTIDS